MTPAADTKTETARLQEEPPEVRKLIKALLAEAREKPEGLTKNDTLRIIKGIVK